MTGTLDVQRQAEQILDESRSDTLSVIMRMEAADGKDADRQQALRKAAYETLERSLSLRARDVLPARVDEDPEVVARKRQEERRFGVTAPVKTATQAELTADARRSLRPLLRAEPVRKHADSPVQGAVTEFLASRSVLCELTRDELARLTREVPGVRDIYPNRTLRVPRVIAPKNLPSRVTDSKASSWGVSRMGALATWGAFGARGRGVKVGVLDTGVDAAHPDLAGRVAGWAEFDASGRSVPDSQPHDTDRHGTHVAGTIVGGNKSGQWTGVAPEAQVAVALVLDGQKGGSDAQILAGIDWLLLNQKVDVINMSLGGLTLGSDVPSTYTEAILTCLRRGVPVVVAIGNEGSQTSGSPGNDLFAFAVGATDNEDRPAGFSGGRTQVIEQSNFIPPDLLPLPYSKPELAAPGFAIRSAVPEGKWEFLNGTSMAAPHAAGAIALLLSATDIRTKIPAGERAFFIQSLLTGAVEELGEAGQDHRYGFGRLDVLRAIGFAKEQGL